MDINDLTNLKTLAIIGTNLTGQIPAVLGLIPGLTTLILSYNGFSGDIDTLGNAPKLEVLDLSYNRLSALKLPTTLPPALKVLLLDGNKFQGKFTTDVASTWGSWKKSVFPTTNLRFQYLAFVLKK